MSNSLGPLGEAALRLAAKGMTVFPCLADKKPAIAEWQKKATTDENIIRGWWRSTDHNIGIATGPRCGVWVLDIDSEEGEQLIREHEQNNGECIPQTVEAVTGKGRHLYFRWPAGRTIRNKQNSVVMPGIDVRGDGGYVLAPPSLHPSGRRYAWSVDSGQDFEDAPEWLIELIISPPPATSWGEPSSWQTFLDIAIEASQRHTQCARLYGLLIRRHVDPALALGLVRLFNDQRCRPPLPEAELQRLSDDLDNLEVTRLQNGRGNAWA